MTRFHIELFKCGLHSSVQSAVDLDGLMIESQSDREMPIVTTVELMPVGKHGVYNLEKKKCCIV